MQCFVHEDAELYITNFLAAIHQLLYGAFMMQSVEKSSQKHPISRPLGRDMGCFLWEQTLIYVM